MYLIETDRLLLRELSLDDLVPLTEILSDPAVMKYSVGGIYNEEKTKTFLEWCFKCYKSHGNGPLALMEKSSSQLIGFCGISPEKVKEKEEVKLGYRLAKKYWGKGFATESSIGILNDAFRNQNKESVIVIINPEHIVSLKVAKKVGFKDFVSCVFHEQKVHLYRLNYSQWIQHIKK
ncbi:MAG: GNAT family N-acetyltransferase [Magnetococcales bacterium]|nr:GNAT family N-acetyltransferase [Magnetococcales bacterium]